MGVILGLSGDSDYDAVYLDFAKKYFPQTTIACYKNIFGESFTAPAFGVYAAAECIQKGMIPEALLYSKNGNDIQKPRRILVYNHFQNVDHSLILLSE